MSPRSSASCHSARTSARIPRLGEALDRASRAACRAACSAACRRPPSARRPAPPGRAARARRRCAHPGRSAWRRAAADRAVDRQVPTTEQCRFGDSSQIRSRPLAGRTGSSNRPAASGRGMAIDGGVSPEAARSACMDTGRVGTPRPLSIYSCEYHDGRLTEDRQRYIHVNISSSCQERPGSGSRGLAGRQHAGGRGRRAAVRRSPAVSPAGDRRAAPAPARTPTGATGAGA